MKQVVFRVLLIIGIQPVSFIGVSYNGSIRGLGPRGEGSTPSTPTNFSKHRKQISSWRKGRRRRLRHVLFPVRIRAGIPKCPCSRIGIGTALRTQSVRVRVPPRTPTCGSWCNGSTAVCGTAGPGLIPGVPPNMPS